MLKLTLMNCCRETSTDICASTQVSGPRSKQTVCNESKGEPQRTCCTTYGVSCSRSSDVKRMMAVITPITVTAAAARSRA